MINKKKGYILVALAGLFWSTIGLFTNLLLEEGFISQQIAFIRLFMAFAFLALYCLIKKRNAFFITKKAFIITILMGLLPQALFNLFYLQAIQRLGTSLSTVLLYTSPIFVALFSKLFHKEVINSTKVISLICCILGAVIAVAGGSLDLASMNTFGLLLGFVAAVLYSLTPILTKNVLKDNESISLLLYAFFFGMIFLLPLVKPVAIIQNITSVKTVLFMMGIGLIPSVLAFLSYLGGISVGIDLSVAGVLSSTELIFAQLISLLILNEGYTMAKFLGTCLMVISALLAMKPTKQLSE